LGPKTVSMSECVLCRSCATSWGVWCGYEVKSSIRLLNKAVVVNLSIITSAHSTTQFSRMEIRCLEVACRDVESYATVPQMPLQLSSAESKFQQARLELRNSYSRDCC
jgi:hypothetical protein